MLDGVQGVTALAAGCTCMVGHWGVVLPCRSIEQMADRHIETKTSRMFNVCHHQLVRFKSRTFLKCAPPQLVIVHN